MTITFPTEVFKLPSSPKSFFKLYLPKDKMTFDKEHLFNYGLDLQSFLDENINKPAKSQITIPSNQSYTFYVVAISNRCNTGSVRAGFELQEHDLIYKINDYQFNSGNIIAKD